MTWLETDSRMRMPKSAVSAAYCSGFSSRACTTWYPYARTFATVVATRRKSAPECSRMRSSTARSMSAAALVLLRRLLHRRPLEEVVDEVVELTPQHVGEELADRAGHHRAAPDDGFLFAREDEVHRHDRDPAARLRRQQVLLVRRHRLLFHAKHAWDRRAGDVAVEDADAEAPALQAHREQSRDERFPHPAFPGHDRDDVLDALLLGHAARHALRAEARRGVRGREPLRQLA